MSESTMQSIRDAPNCYMCRILGLHTNEIRCRRCESIIESNV